MKRELYGKTLSINGFDILDFDMNHIDYRVFMGDIMDVRIYGVEGATYNCEFDISATDEHKIAEQHTCNINTNNKWIYNEETGGFVLVWCASSKNI